MRLVVLESPYAGDVPANIAYAREAMRDCILVHGESPFASHMLLAANGVLEDKDQVERNLGILAGLRWGEKADATVVYTDLGISPGMKLGIEHAERHGRPVEYRSLRDAGVA